MANELLEFEDGTLGIALNLDTREIGVVVLGDFDKIEEGQTVHINVIEDPEVLGGLRVEIGDEVIDGTVRTRLDDVRRRLAG